MHIAYCLSTKCGVSDTASISRGGVIRDVGPHETNCPICGSALVRRPLEKKKKPKKSDRVYLEGI